MESAFVMMPNSSVGGGGGGGGGGAHKPKILFSVINISSL